MKFTTKLFLAIAFVGSLALTSCKDSNEDDYQNAIAKTLDLSGVLGKMDDLQKKINELEAKSLKECGCYIKDLGNGNYEIKAGNGAPITMGKVYYTNEGILVDKEGKPLISDAVLKGAGFTTNADGTVSGVKLPDGTIFNFADNKVTPVTDKDGKTLIGLQIGKSVYDIKTGSDITGIFEVKDGKIVGAKVDGATTYTPIKTGSTVSVEETDGKVSSITIDGKKYTVSTGGSTGNAVKFEKDADNNITGITVDGVTYTFKTTTGDKVSYVTDADKNITGIDINGTKYEFNPKAEFVYDTTDPTKVVGIKIGGKEYKFEKGDALVVEFVKDDKDDPKKITGVKIGTEVYHFEKAQDLTSIISRIETLEKNYTTLKDIVGDDTKGLVKDVKDLNDRIKAAEDNISDMQDDIKALQDDVEDLQKQIDTINDTLKDLQDQIDEINDRLDAIEETIAKLVTGIEIQQVYNPVFGSYNDVFTNLQSNMLMAFYGQDENGVVLADYEGNAGKIYITVNPNTVDFTGLELQLVNSLDQQSGIKLGKLQQSYDLLHLGWTRAASNGFYEAPASLTLSGFAGDWKNLDVIGNMKIDKGAIMNAVKDYIHNKKDKEKAKVAIKELATTAFNAAKAVNGLQALGVKCSYKELDVEKNIHSNYNMTGVAVKALTFDALDDLAPKELKLYNKGIKFLYNVHKRVTDKIVNTINKELEDYEDKLAQRGIIKVEPSYADSCAYITVSYVGDENVKTKLQEMADKGLGNIVSHDPVAKQIVVKYNLVQITNLTADYDDVNHKIDVDADLDAITGTTNIIAMNDLVNMSDMVNKLIKTIHDYEDKITDSKKYLDKVVAKLDKINDKIQENLPLLLKPVLLVNSDKGLSKAGVPGAPSYVSGNVTVYPTTYNAEVVSPILTKKIKVNGQLVSVNGKTALDPSVKSVDITSYLQSGENTVIVQYTDFNRNSVTETYQINK